MPVDVRHLIKECIKQVLAESLVGESNPQSQPIDLTPTGRLDDWSRPIYQSKSGRIYVDVNCGNGTPDIHSVTDEGEPDMPLRNYQIVKSSNEGFDPTSMGPNPEATEGNSNPNPYAQWNSEMRKMETVDPSIPEKKSYHYRPPDDKTTKSVLPPSGEEKYYKQEPGGTMGAVNVDENNPHGRYAQEAGADGFGAREFAVNENIEAKSIEHAMPLNKVPVGFLFKSHDGNICIRMEDGYRWLKNPKTLYPATSTITVFPVKIRPSTFNRASTRRANPAPEDGFNKFREQVGADRVDEFLAKFGLGPKYKPAKLITEEKTFQQIRDEHDPDGTKHDLTLTCIKCGAKHTCRCTKPKKEFKGICPDCSKLSEIVGTPSEPEQYRDSSTGIYFCNIDSNKQTCPRDMKLFPYVLTHRATGKSFERELCCRNAEDFLKLMKVWNANGTWKCEPNIQEGDLEDAEDNDDYGENVVCPKCNRRGAYLENEWRMGGGLMWKCEHCNHEWQTEEQRRDRW